MHQVEGRLAASVTRAQKAEANVSSLQRELAQTKAHLAVAQARVGEAEAAEEDHLSGDVGSTRALRQSSTQAARRFRVMQSDFEAAMKLMLKHSSSFKQLASVMESMDRVSFPE
jgi:methionine synthase I (cobalamin-dependent)